MNEYRYQQIAEVFEQQILKEILQPGNKLPSLRMICTENEVSLSTALKAYYTLESKSLIESRPNSGYFVAYTPKRFHGIPLISNPSQHLKAENIDEILISIVENMVFSSLGQMNRLAGFNKLFFTIYYKFSAPRKYVKHLLCLLMIMQLLTCARRHAFLDHAQGIRF